MVPFSENALGSGVAGGIAIQRLEFDPLHCTVRPHLNLELGLGVGIRTLANSVKPEEKEYQMPSEAN